MRRFAGKTRSGFARGVLAEGSVEGDFFLHEGGEDGVVAVALRFREQVADLALAALHAAALEGMEGVGDELGGGMVGGGGGVGGDAGGFEGAGEEGAGGVVGRGVEGVSRVAGRVVRGCRGARRRGGRRCTRDGR